MEHTVLELWSNIGGVEYICGLFTFEKIWAASALLGRLCEFFLHSRWNWKNCDWKWMKYYWSRIIIYTKVQPQFIFIIHSSKYLVNFLLHFFNFFYSFFGFLSSASLHSHRVTGQFVNWIEFDRDWTSILSQQFWGASSLPKKLRLLSKYSVATSLYWFLQNIRNTLANSILSLSFQKVDYKVYSCKNPIYLLVYYSEILKKKNLKQ